MKRSLIFVVLFMAIVCSVNSCKEQDKDSVEVISNSSIDGIWESIGHGWILQIENKQTYSFYDITSISCVLHRKGNFQDLEDSVTLEGDTLVLVSGEITYRCTRADQLNVLCEKELDRGKLNDPLYNFDVFVETVKEHYAFLELNNIDLVELAEIQRAKLNTNSSSAELYLVIEETFEILNDNHAFLNATDDVYEAIDELESVEEGDDSDEVEELGDFPVGAAVAKHHLEREMTKDSWLINWGMMTNDIGYIQLKAMWLFADFNMPKELVDSMGFIAAYELTRDEMYEIEYMEKEIAGVRKVMDKVMLDLAEAKSIVIDVRFNGGGQDVVSFEVLNRFCSESIQVATHKFRYGNTHTPVSKVNLEGSKDAYTNPVYILTSPQSGSAAETFALSSMSMKNIKRIGSATEGAISTTLDKKLPIGWDFCVSNEIYMDNQGEFYENRGVPVDFDLNYFRDRQTFFRSVIADLDKDKKDILYAIERLPKD